MLSDVLTHQLDVVFCGTAKGEASARLGCYYAGRGNKFYSTLHEVGLTPHKLEPNQCYDISGFGIGLTDLVHSESDNDNQISKEAYDVDGFLKKIEEFKPKFIAFNGKRSASFVFGLRGKTRVIDFGLQDDKIAGAEVYVLPSTSGLASKYWDKQYWVDLGLLVQKMSPYK